MKRFFLASSFFFAICGLVQAQNLTGDWQGTLKIGQSELRLVLHVADNNGAYKATLDSIDQPGGNGIPVSAFLFKAPEINFAADAVHGSYSGKIDTNGTEIHGTWTQGASWPLDFKHSSTPVKTVHGAAAPSDIDGDWQGTLAAGTGKLRLVFHIVNTDDGLTATLDSIDQNVKGIPVTNVARDGDSLVLQCRQIDGKFNGTISGDRRAIDGTWTQNGGSLPLILARASQ